MRKPLVTGLVIGLVAVGAPAARADHAGYAGGCAATVFNDTTPGQALGGQNQWSGTISALVVATDANGTPTASSISVDCELRVNGMSQGVVLTAAGTGAAGSAGQLSFTAEVDDVVTLCDHVSVDGETFVPNCGDVRTAPLVPQPVVDLLNTTYTVAYSATVEVLLMVFAAVGSIVHSTGPLFIDVLDPTLCPFFATAYPGVPGVVNIKPEGDVDLFGDPYYDCPPYDIHH